MSYRGKKFLFQLDDILFVDYHVYDYLFDYYIDMSKLQQKQLELGRAAQ